ncbi:DinB family protein [Galbibacter sp.]|uniref:DinB family protein n=1 Tax=Galbibacter sp. TaxID=2918471 RepID=UPI002C14E557|nr:DinB family protein [Galbibacter sp.]HLV62152.1 DinB family protein [Galbibacter sp.]
MKRFFKELFEYNHHFNQMLSDIFIENPDKTSQKAVNLFNHILNAHQIWNNRIHHEQASFGVWELHDNQDIKNIDRINYEQSLRILEKFVLDDSIGYSNTKGHTFNNRIQDIYFHIINHSTYHRGQITTEFRLKGLDPLNTDYIFYKRQ